MTRQGLIFSLLIHGLLLLFVIVGVPWSAHKDLQLMAPTPVEVVMEKPRTRRVSTPPPSKTKPTPPVEKEPEAPKTPPAKPEHPTPAPAPEAKPEVKPEAKPEPKVAEKPKAEPQPSTAKPETKPTPQPTAKPKAKPKPQSKEGDFSDYLEKNLQDIKAAQKSDEKSDTDGAPNDLTSEEQAALNKQFKHCWSNFGGMPRAHDLLVDIKLVINPDRTVKSAEIINRPATPSPFYQSMSENALRAVRHPKCSPLDLPPHKYDVWKNLEFSFNPKKLLGGY